MVDLYDTNDDTDVNIGDMLVEMGFAKAVETTTDVSCNVSESGSGEIKEVFIPG